jgi:hypothetical protein
MALNDRPTRDTKPYSLTQIGNQSFDQDFQVSMAEMLGYEETENTLHRLRVNKDGSVATPLPDKSDNPRIVMEYTDGLMTKVTKTINGQDYERILTYTDGLLTQADPWSAV